MDGIHTFFVIYNQITAIFPFPFLFHSFYMVICNRIACVYLWDRKQNSPGAKPDSLLR